MEMTLNSILAHTKILSKNKFSFSINTIKSKYEIDSILHVTFSIMCKEANKALLYETNFDHKKSWNVSKI